MDTGRQVYVCLNDDCCKRGNEAMYADLTEQCASLADVEVREYICFGNCDYGANVVVLPDKVWFSGLRQGDSTVIMSYLRDGEQSDKHTGKVDTELAEAIWEILELEADTGEPTFG
jgi:(2Fe-2S) ferredoxin